MTNSTCYRIPESELEDRLASDVVPSIESLRKAGMKIVPWSEPNFWDNIKSQKFSELFCRELFDSLVSLTCKPAKSKKDTGKEQNYTKEMEGHLISILHIIITYRRMIPDAIWRESYDKLIMAGLTSISAVMIHISKLLCTSELNMKTVLDAITGKNDYPLLLSTVPIFNYLNIIRMVRESVSSCNNLFLAFRTRLESLHAVSEAACLLHIIKVIITIFPGIPNNLIESLIEPLHESLLYPIPVSLMGEDIGSMIEKEMNYPGAGYFDMLRYIGESNIATNGAIPFIFDPGERFLPSFLHTRQNTDLSLETNLIHYGNFFLTKKFKEHPKKPKQVMKFLRKLEFSEASMEKIIKKFKITSSDNDPPPFNVKLLEVPHIRLAPVKLSVNFSLNPSLVTECADGSKFFVTPTSTIIESQVVQPLIKFFEECKEHYIHKIVVCGGDMFFSNIILSFTSIISQHRSELTNMIPMFYLIPLGHELPSAIARYIASYDDTYSRFVNDIYHVISTMAPQLDDTASSYFPSIITSQPEGSNVWYTNPAPSAMFQFCIQHYLIFARFSINCYVWKAILEFDCNTVTVPFIVSLHIGTQYAEGKYVDTSEKKIKINKYTITTDVDPNPHLVELTSLVLWNLNVEERISPTDQHLLLETVNDPTKPDIRPHRSNLGEKSFRAPITRATIECAEKTPRFNVLIDQRVFGPVKSVTVAGMDPLFDSENQFRIRIATFVPC